ncbi:probable ATP-dependent RNA helicase DDX60 isoform X1 [Acropora millepora]|uniref:probable ATP-dependent RNA helicase DDX60 isoform X1 n=1 Tax=Acropora millepora TaxID=45264 RepID=UPI001CF36819|nr:probable ATP-dependent RNA helicase DDX60 isoform X1 [Acropora millepora]XP_044173203.1 probable ATP-dependent RNA helicase DDX60 isoform X1 [Acropora millepora]
MAEKGEHYHSSSDDNSDASLFDSDDEEDDADYADEADEVLSDDLGEETNDEEEFGEGSDTEFSDEEPGESQKDEGDVCEFVRERFYGEYVTARCLNILTDFVDAEIFMIDGDSLLFELLGEESLDWSHGGQFLHLIYLLERFLQHFTDKGGVFHIVFFKDMETIWKTQPSMLLARQTLILHLQHNTSFTVVTSINHFWSEEWKEYVQDQIPAFMLLTDAENIPWKTERGTKAESVIQFLFRSLLMHCLGQGLNCVYISGIQMTATKVLGFYMESSAEHKAILRKRGKSVLEKWLDQASGNNLRDAGTYSWSPSQIDVEAEVQTALQSPPQGGCRELVTVLACSNVLFKFLNGPDISEETVETVKNRMKLFLLHTVLLNKLPLKYRAQSVNSTLLDEFSKTEDGKVYPLHEIHLSLWEILKSMDDRNACKSLDMTSVADLMDGRFLHTLICLPLEQTSKGLEGLNLPESVINEAETAWSKVVATVNNLHPSGSLESQFYPLFAKRVTEPLMIEEESYDREPAGERLRRLLEVENPLVSEYAGDMRTQINAMAGDEDEDEPVFNIGREFDEVYHWHSLRPLSDDFDRTTADEDKPPDDPYKRKWYFKRKQYLSRFQTFYGNSLVDGIDKAKTITVTETETKKKAGKNKQGKMCKKAAQIIEDNKQKRKEQAKEKDQEKWNSIFKEFESNLKSHNYDTALQLVEKYESECKSPEFRLQALMKRARGSFDAWKHTRTFKPNSSDMKYPVLLMESVQKIFQSFQSLLKDKDKKRLAGFIQKLGFDDVAAMFWDLQPESGKQAVQLSVHTTSARFQLEHMGHLLKREERTDADPRVDHFIPDTWQRELLDAVDKNESAVIVAPTSSGKTYASYYCMEKVLRQSNDGVVVYVSPTKALVNQVVATVYARFHRKQLPDGRAVYGVFTRDYRHNTLNSQILVTVPQCLEILFLSPHRQEWTKNVKYVIFDEVHCLGEEIGAEVWEHLLLLIRCPFLALSATIGNPRDLMTWLQAAQDFREQQDKQDKGKLRNSYRIRLVTCKERYSDLEKCVYLPSPIKGGFSKEKHTYKKEYEPKNSEEFVRLHPCAQLGPKQLLKNGFPGDMALTPGEALQLYDVMVKEWPDKESIQKLSPEKYFLENKLIRKSHARQYELEVKKELKSWADEKQSKKVQCVIQSLNSVCQEKQDSTEDEWSDLGLPSCGDSFILRNFPKLVDQLRAQDKLPALVFSFNRVMCERLSRRLTVEFENREADIRARDGQRALKLAERRRAKAEKKLKKTRDETEKEKAQRIASQQGEGNEEDFSALDEPLPECTLAFTHGIGKQDMDKIMARIRFVKSRDIFKRGLKRGVSYHHAGLHTKMRSSVEMLFRKKCLQVVAATGTLALGIHMPCKTVVFAGDSPYLNSLQYRQMSGRAGRRGFDPVGNVVFFGVPYRKVQRLITANIPKLVGNFPINVSLVLRLLLMTSKGDDEKDALTKALTLLSHPFICQKHPETENQIKKHFLFSVELLARLSLINIETGAPQEMAGLATHLHYHEPSNYVLVSFLQSGLFHDLCQPGLNGKFSEDVMRKMVLILSHLFGRRFLHPSFKRRIHLCPTSKVILEDLPDKFAQAIQDYNRQVTEVFSQYLKTVAGELEKDLGEEKKLPLSGIEFPDTTSITDLVENDTIKSLARSSIAYSACSSFSALSGNSDLHLHSTDQKTVVHWEREESVGEGSEENEDKSDSDEEDEAEHREPIEHLLKIIRQDVYTDMNVVPILPLKKANSVGRVMHLNAYALDFFKHGSEKAIERENGIKAGDVFFLLKDFCLTIKSISCSLEELGPEDDNVVLAFKQLAREFGEKFNNQF